MGCRIVDDIAVSISPKAQHRMRLLQQYEIATLFMVKGKKDKKG